MASYSALLAFSGFSFDMPNHTIGFHPIVEGDFRCFWSLNSGWGVFERNGSGCKVEVLYGEITLKKLMLPFMAAKKASLNGTYIAFACENGELVFDQPVTLKAGETNRMEIV